MAPQRTLRDLILSREPIVKDGGMGTSLYEKGFYINRSFEELCLTHAKDVEAVVQDFKDAGAQLLSTNTFGANTPKLMEYGLQDKLRELIQTAVQINQRVAGDDAYVIGSIGPLGLLFEPLGPTSIAEGETHFRSVAQAFHDARVDGMILETFHDLTELEAAVRAVRSVSDKPLIASIAVQENFKTSFGHSLKEFARKMEATDIDVIGLNCQVGPTVLLEAVEKLHELTQLPISVAPNAGLPRFVNDRYIYMCSPDYLGKYAKKFIQAGAQIVGGCCGTNHHHIRAISNTLRMHRTLSQSRQRVRVDTVPAVEVATSPVNERSQLGSAIIQNKFPVSVELVPPVGVNVSKFLEQCHILKEGGVRFVNIPDSARAMARMSSLHLAALVQREVGLEAIPHFTSRDRNLIGIQADLIGSHANGVRNVLLVTGDPPKLGNCPDATAVYDVDAIGLTHIVNRMNHGLDLGGSSFGEPAEFVVGVALNPTSINPDLEWKRFQYKEGAGAHFAITQPIYDIDAYQEFFEKHGSPRIPIIMGIWPLVSFRNAEFLKYEVPGVSVPDWIISEMEKVGESKDDALKRGLEIAYKTMERARPLVAGFQVSAPFNRVDVALDVIHAL